MLDNQPPHSKENEMMVLGSMLTNPESLKIVAQALNSQDFYFSEHKILFQILKEFHKNNIPADLHLACEELKRQDKLKAVGGVSYVTAVAQYAGTSAYVEKYIDLLKEDAGLRVLISIAQDIQKKAIDKEPFYEVLSTLTDQAKHIQKYRLSKDKFPIQFLVEREKNYLLTDPPKKPMLLEFANEEGSSVGFLPKGIVAMLVGAGGVGKTHLLAQLAISIASGDPWLDFITTTDTCGTGKKGNVFLGLGENQYDDIHRVLYKASKKLREHLPDVLEKDPILEASKRIAAFSFCGQQAAFIQDGSPSQYFREFKLRLQEIAPPEGWSLIILDPVSRLLGSDAEKDNATATQFIALLEELSIELPGNPTILFAHHVNKSAIKPMQDEQSSASQADSRGASALTDGVRWQANLRKDGENYTLVLTKSNFTAMIPPIVLSKNDEGIIKAVSKQKSLPKKETLRPTVTFG